LNQSLTAAGKALASGRAPHHAKPKEVVVNATKIVAILLIVAGLLGLIYQQFSFTKETHQAKIGPLELSVKEKETVNVPLWLSLGAVGVGVVILVTGGRRK
jgi:NADH:ubiquinone oxidoreductase subunit 5 (subunit L)/multisubunit Na+/H+ antiporter MnhA subunit